MKILNSLIIAAALIGASSQSDAAKKVEKIGDSMMQTYDESKTMTRRCGQFLQQFFDGMELNNRAKA